MEKAAIEGEPIKLWHPQITQDHVIATQGDEFQGALPVVRALHLVAITAKGYDKRTHKTRLGIHNENRHRRVRCHCAPFPLHMHRGTIGEELSVNVRAGSQEECTTAPRLSPCQGRGPCVVVDTRVKGFGSEGFNACQRRQRLFFAPSRGFYRVDLGGFREATTGGAHGHPGTVPRSLFTRRVYLVYNELTNWR
jgi:hypothetical protein